MAADETLEILVRLRDGRVAEAGLKRLSGETRNLASQTDRQARASDRASRSGWRLRSAWGALIATGGAALALLGGGGLVGGLVSVGKAYAESEKVATQTNAVIKSTGGAANVTAKRVGDLATTWSRATGIDDELIQSGENMLLTFRNIRNEAGKGNDIFDQTTKQALNMSAAFTAMGKDMTPTDAMMQLGKAINDPIHGMSRLQRIGVTFTDQQVEQAKALQENGDLMGAQRVILNELAKEFGGSARKQGQTLAGTWGKVTTEFGNVQEALGKMAAPWILKGLRAVQDFFVGVQRELPRLQRAFKRGGVEGLVKELDRATHAGGYLMKALDVIQWTIRAIGDVVAWAGRNWDWLMPVLAALATFVGTLKVIAALTRAWIAVQSALNVAMTANPIGLIVAGVAALAAGFYLLYERVAWFRNGVNAVIDFVVEHWKTLVAAIPVIGPLLWVVVNNFKRIKDTAVDTFNWIRNAVNNLVGFFDRLPDRVSAAVTGLFDGIWEAFKGAVNKVIMAWNGLEFHMGGTDLGPLLGHLPSVNVGTPDIPLLAEGGDVARRGAAIVGDRGPELLELPEGARVTPLGGGAPWPREVVRLVTVDGRVLAEAVFDHAERARARA